MKSAATIKLEGQSGGAALALDAPLAAREKLAAYIELTKPRITFLILLIALAGFCLGSTRGSFDYAALGHVLIGITLLSSGIAALNQVIESELDGLMRRTQARPLPSGRLSESQAFVFGIGLTVIGEIYLSMLVNPLTALLGVLTAIGYVLVYTPLKTRTTLSTAIGALPGAMPPLLGWAAARGHLNAEAWALFAILFLWQFPHFLAIAWMYREDYGRAGIRMLPVVAPDGRSTSAQIIGFTVLLLPVSLLPVALGTSGMIYLWGAVVLGALFLASGVQMARARTRQAARRLLLASVIYLPLLFALLVANKH
ncbi:MAG: heme o synthase [Pyrinomonadaceae bacterium]